MSDDWSHLIGTPWKRHANEPGVGIDCWHLAQRVASSVSPVPTSTDRRDQRRIEETCFREIPKSDPLRCGDVLTFRNRGRPWDDHCIVAISQRWGLDVAEGGTVRRVRLRRFIGLAHRVLRPGGDTTLARHVAGPGFNLGAFLILTAISTGLSLGAAYLMRPDSPREEDATDGGPTYGWEGITLRRTRGSVIPVVYGKHLVGGQLLQQYTRADQDGNERLYMLICLGHGEFDAVCGMTEPFDRLTPSELTQPPRINDNPATQYEGLLISGRIGSVDQEAIPGFNERVAEFPQSFPLVNTSGSERTGDEPGDEAFSYTTETEVEWIEFNMRFPEGLYRQTTGGALAAVEVKWRYRWRVHDSEGAHGPWSSWSAMSTSRRHTGAFGTTTRQVMPERGVYDLEIERVSVDASNEFRRDATTLKSISEITSDRFEYPGLALLAVEGAAMEQLNTNAPTVKTPVRGRKVAVWDGIDENDPTFTAPQFASNPAWITRDFLTNETFGMGRFIDSVQLAPGLPSLVEWGQHCDELVEIVGGEEDRCRFDGVFDQETTAWEILERLCRSGRASPIVEGSTIRFAVDKPSDPVQLFSDGNILTGSLAVSYRGTRSEPNALTCQYLDAGDDFRQTPYTAEDPTAADRGELYHEESIELYGVTRRTQIARDVLLRLSAKRNSRKTIRFETSVEGINCEVGDVIRIAHHVPQWAWSGRVRSAEIDTVTLDRTITFEAGHTYEIALRLSSDVVETKRIVHPGGGIEETTVPAGQPIRIESAWTVTPAEHDVYAVGVVPDEAGGKPIEAIIKSLEIRPDLTVAITALEYHPEVYADELIIVDQGDSTGLDGPGAIPGNVQDLTMLEGSQQLDGAERPMLSLSWSPPLHHRDIVGHYEVYYRPLGDFGWAKVPTPYRDTYAEVGGYVETDTAWEFTVVAVSTSGAKRHPDSTPRVSTALGWAGDPPPPPASVFESHTGNVYSLTWVPVEGAAGYEVRVWSASLRDSVLVARTTTEQLDGLYLAPGQTHEFQVRAYNKAGRHSLTATRYTISNVPPPVAGAIRQTSVVNLQTGTALNLTWDTSRYEITDTASPGYWVSPTIDTGIPAAGGIYVLPSIELQWLDDDGDGPRLNDMPFRIAGPNSDPWTIDEPVRPAYPDDAYGMAIEVSTSDDGSNWTPFDPIGVLENQAATFRYVRFRATLTTEDPFGLFAPALAGFTVVTTE
jgi:hypothetical protein